MECYFNSTQVQDLSSPTYPYKHYIESMLSYSKDCKLSFLRAEMFHEENDERKKMIESSKECYFSLRPSIDVFNSEKMLPPGLADDVFCRLTVIYFSFLKLQFQVLISD